MCVIERGAAKKRLMLLVDSEIAMFGPEAESDGGTR